MLVAEPLTARFQICDRLYFNNGNRAMARPNGGHRIEIVLAAQVLAARVDRLRGSQHARGMRDGSDPWPRAPTFVPANAGAARTEPYAGRLADSHSPLQGRIGGRDLETRRQRPLRFAQGLSDLPVVGRPWPEDQGRRPPGTRGL